MNPLLILDADGVFMDETPYWNTALVVALRRYGLACSDGLAWEALSRACFVEQRVQVVTKGRGCNSNWDLAAVMIRALEERKLRHALENEAFLTFARRLENAMEGLWRSVQPSDPLDGFGIERGGEFFKQVVVEFQHVFENVESVDWQYVRQRPSLPLQEMRSLFLRWNAAGFTLGVCTSRCESETIEPMSCFGILEYFDRGHFATNDQVVAAEHRLAAAPLAKPHPFPLVCAAIGFDAALQTCDRGSMDADACAMREVIYVGDTLADFEAARRARDLGLRVSYCHIDSGLTPSESRSQIEESDLTLFVAGNLAECAENLVRLAVCTDRKS